MDLRDLLDEFSYNITSGYEFGWKCWPGARGVDIETEHGFLGVIFDPISKIVYEATAESKKLENTNTYRWWDTTYVDDYIAEADERGVDLNIAYDDVKYVQLETESDFLNKASELLNGVEQFVSLEVNIDDDVFYKLAKMAHEQDITLNQLINNVLREYINTHPLPVDSNQPIDPPEHIDSFTAVVTEDSNGECILTFPEAFIKQEDWREGDVIEWSENFDDGVLAKNISKMKRDEEGISQELNELGL